MKGLHFFDYRELKHLDGFGRVVESPVKDAGAPLMTPDMPSEHGNNRLLGSVVLAAKWGHYHGLEAPPSCETTDSGARARWP